MVNWSKQKFVVCPDGHINLIQKGDEMPKFCYECGKKIDYSPEGQNINRCKKCGKPISKNLGRLSNGFAEEYKDTGLCINCWIIKNKPELERLKVEAIERAS